MYDEIPTQGKRIFDLSRYVILILQVWKVELQKGGDNGQIC